MKIRTTKVVFLKMNMKEAEMLTQCLALDNTIPQALVDNKFIADGHQGRYADFLTDVVRSLKEALDVR